MQLRYIDAKTRMDIEVLSDKPETLTGSFIDTDRGASFYIECDELFQNFEGYKAARLRLSFYRGAAMYTFDARLTSAGDKNGTNALLLEANSLIEETSRRGAPRLQMQIETKIYSQGKPILIGVTHDISTTGLSLLSNELYDLGETEYIAEFSVADSTYNLPLRFIRMGNAPQLVQYRYDYAFLFTINPEATKIKELTMSLFKYKMRTR